MPTASWGIPGSKLGRGGNLPLQFCGGLSATLSGDGLQGILFFHLGLFLFVKHCRETAIPPSVGGEAEGSRMDLLQGVPTSFASSETVLRRAGCGMNGCNSGQPLPTCHDTSQSTGSSLQSCDQSSGQEWYTLSSVVENLTSSPGKHPTGSSHGGFSRSIIQILLVQIIEETLPALQRLKEAGKVRFIGITGLPLKIYKYVLDRVPPGTVDVVLSYCHYSLNDQSLGELLPYLQVDLAFLCRFLESCKRNVASFHTYRQGVFLWRVPDGGCSETLLHVPDSLFLSS